MCWKELCKMLTVENTDKIWQIDLWFAKTFPANVLQICNLISYDPVDLT